MGLFSWAGSASAALLWLSGAAMAQSVAEPGNFDPVAVVDGIAITRSACAGLERRDTAVWVEADGQAVCLRYYAAGLKPARNAIAALWLNGDVLGPRGGDARKRQSGFGPADMVALEERLAARFGVASIFLGRPGTYGSGGRHHAMRGRPIEAALIDAALDGLKRRYGIGAWALGGHSGGATLVAEMLARRTDLRCAVISSGAAAYRAFLEARGLARPGDRITRFDPFVSLDKVPPDPERRIFVIGDPRESNVPFSTQKLYFDGLVARGHAAWLVALARATDRRHHGLVDFGETAAGFCAGGRGTGDILAALSAMPDPMPRMSN
jgi:pimeloyl-ACP methyl ester carboxylesterase